MHAQSDSGGCGKLIVSGFINAEDNKATEQKTERSGQRLRIKPYVRNYLATLIPMEYAQSFPLSSTRSRGLITGR
jgi:hypothetical protein